MKEKLAQLLKTQVGEEFFSSYLYFSMSNWCLANGWNGAAHWLMLQSKEELTHGVSIQQFIVGQQVDYVPTQIDAPKVSWGSLVELFEQVYEHEKHVTSLINAIADEALEQKQHATYQFILGFVKEQIEEEESSYEILKKARIFQSRDDLMLRLDAELSSRA